MGNPNPRPMPHYRPAYAPRAPGMPVQITCSIPAKLFEKLEAACKRRDCTRAAMTAELIAKGLESE